MIEWTGFTEQSDTGEEGTWSQKRPWGRKGNFQSRTEQAELYSVTGQLRPPVFHAGDHAHDSVCRGWRGAGLEDWGQGKRR